MSALPPIPPQRVPTLTEVVSWPRAAAASLALESPAEPAPPQLPMRVPERMVIEGVLAEVQRQVELMLDYRLREVLTPLLSRAADSIVRDARTELASTLRDVVARAVAQEVARHRER